MSNFEYPWEYQFPPFFTIQPNLETRKLQLEAWRSLILDYCQHHNIHQLNLRDWLGKPPFSNDKIDRRLDLDSIRLIINSLVMKRFAEWIGKDQESCLIYSRPPEQWAQIIRDYVKEKSLYNHTSTFYDLLIDDSTKDREFHQLDETVLLRALKILEKSGEAVVIDDGGAKGVKWFQRK